MAVVMNAQTIADAELSGMSLDSIIGFTVFGGDNVKRDAQELLCRWTSYRTTDITAEAFTEFAMMFNNEEMDPKSFLKRVCSIAQSYWPDCPIDTQEDLAFTMEQIAETRFKPLVKLMLDCETRNVLEAKGDAVDGIMHTPLVPDAFYVCVNGNKAVGFEFGDLMRSILCQGCGNIRCPYSNATVISLAFMTMPFDVIAVDTWKANVAALWMGLKNHKAYPVGMGEGTLLPWWADAYEVPAHLFMDQE